MCPCCDLCLYFSRARNDHVRTPEHAEETNRLNDTEQMVDRPSLSASYPSRGTEMRTTQIVVFNRMDSFITPMEIDSDV